MKFLQTISLSLLCIAPIQAFAAGEVSVSCLLKANPSQKENLASVQLTLPPIQDNFTYGSGVLKIDNSRSVVVDVEWSRPLPPGLDDGPGKPSQHPYMSMDSRLQESTSNGRVEILDHQMTDSNRNVELRGTSLTVIGNLQDQSYYSNQLTTNPTMSNDELYNRTAAAPTANYLIECTGPATVP
jgi:hypothetical protein